MLVSLDLCCVKKVWDMLKMSWTSAVQKIIEQTVSDLADVISYFPVLVFHPKDLNI